MELNVTQEQLTAWESGVNIQVAMPQLDADEREFIKTGVTPTEWNELFGEEEDEEDNYDEGQPSWEQEWEDFGEVYSDEY
jgi:transcriptional regulator with XRE-family HTH domain